MTDEQAGPELDARVAVEVMGWSYQTFPDGPCPHVKHWYATSPCPENARHESWRAKCPRFSTDPAADYEVLKVARAWPHERQDAFGKTLERIWMGRCNGYLPLWLPLWSMFYEPGDYSRAALDVPPEAKTPLEPQPSKG